MAVTTNTLLKQIINSKDFQKVLERNEEEFYEASLPEYLNGLCEERGMRRGEVIARSQIARTYGYQIFNGVRIPSRDKLIQLAFGFGLSLEETQELLRVSGKSILYAKMKRDAACIFGISHKMSVMEVQDLLESVGVPLLGDGIESKG